MSEDDRRKTKKRLSFGNAHALADTGKGVSGDGTVPCGKQLAARRAEGSGETSPQSVPLPGDSLPSHQTSEQHPC